MKHLKKLCGDIKGKLKKRKYVQTSLSFVPATERPKEVPQLAQSEELWVSSEIARIEKETGSKTKERSIDKAKPWSAEEHEAFLNAIR